MPYSELIKNFDGIRDYMREFYVYGFRSRGEFTRKSARSYDDERRRAESWLGDYMRFRQTADGKNVFFSIDSRVTRHNPLYQAWRAKSFTDLDITLHFLLFDVLYAPEISLTLGEITEELDRRLEAFPAPRTFDASTVRKKLGEYVREGLLTAEKRGKAVAYRRSDAVMPSPDSADALDFFSETSPCGVIGSFLLDRIAPHDSRFAFKHHYITASLDSDILCSLLACIRGQRRVTLTDAVSGKPVAAVPLRIFCSVQSGRQYLMAFMPALRRVRAFRLDRLLAAVPGEPCRDYAAYRAVLDRMQPHLWGVSTGAKDRLGHVEFTVRYADDETFIHRRLEREKRCGCVERLNAHTSRFSADVYDAGELIPWIRTFICRITSVRFSDPVLQARFRQDLLEMYALYGLSGGETT